MERERPRLLPLQADEERVLHVEVLEPGLEDDRLRLAAKTGRFFDLLRTSEHAEEFLDENHRLCGELSAEAGATHTRLLARMLTAAARAGEVSFADAGVSAAQTAELLLDTAEGIKARGRTTLSPHAYRQRLARAVRLLLGGLTPRRQPAVAGRRHASAR